VFGVDQCNHWQAAATSKKGEFRGAERVNSQGMPVSIRSETVLNMVQRQIPFTSPLLTAAEVQLIQSEGRTLAAQPFQESSAAQAHLFESSCCTAYTEDWRCVLRVLNPTAVETARWRWVETTLSLLAPEVHPPSRLQLPETEREVTELLLGKPKVRPTGPSHFKILPVVRKCETQSLEDVAKMWAALTFYMTALTLCVIIICDGQLVDLLRTCRRRFPAEYKRILVSNGPFHSFIHFCFCINEGYWKVLLYTFAITWLKKNKDIYEIMQDLQHDNAKHITDFHRVSASGILSFLLLDVKHPPPSLLITDPRGYLAMVNHAGGIVILQYLFRGGLPILFWQRSIRASMRTRSIAAGQWRTSQRRSTS